MRLVSVLLAVAAPRLDRRRLGVELSGVSWITAYYDGGTLLLFFFFSGVR